MPQSQPILIATRNASKGREIAEIIGAAGINYVTLADFPDPGPEVEETGSTYQENAAIKALDACQRFGQITLSDDAGFEVDAMGREPGLRSRRFMGEETTFEEKMDAILNLLQGVPDELRTCRFNCAVAIATPDGRLFHCDGVLEGQVAHERKGAHGFGYDPIFFLPEMGLHLAELPPDEKHKISHRGQALNCARQVIEKLQAELTAP